MLTGLSQGAVAGSSEFCEARQGMRRPCTLVGPRPRGPAVQIVLNSGMPPAEVAAWAGHSVEVLMRAYAKCMTGLEDVWISRMDDALHLENPEQPE